MKPTSSILNDNSVKVSEIEESIVTTFNDFMLLENHWNFFLDKQPSSLLCVEWTWIKNWIEVYFRKNDTLFLCTYWFEQQLVGVIPCYIKKGRFINELRFIATGENEVDEVCSEFQDFIVDERYRADVFDRFQQVIYIYKIKYLSFNNILVDSNVHLWVSSLNSKLWMVSEEDAGYKFCIKLTNYNSLISILPSKTLRRKMRAVDQQKNYEFAILENPEQFDSFFEKLKIQHQNTWREKGKAGAFSSEYFCDFHYNYAKEMLISKKLLMFTLSFENQVYAVFYGIISGNTLYYYQSGVKRVNGHNNIGAAMHFYAMKIACNLGLRQYDLMKGSFSSYKREYITPRIPILDIYLIRKKFWYISFIQRITSLVQTTIKRAIKIK